jgi:hypothetical protein
VSERPVLQIVRGEPTPEELAVVTAVVIAGAAGGDAAIEPVGRGRWNDPARLPVPMLRPGPGAWASSLR